MYDYVDYLAQYVGCFLKVGMDKAINNLMHPLNQLKSDVVVRLCL